MTFRRIFLLATAALASIAALVAIAAVVSGGFGETEGKIFATLAATFVAGSTLMAGIALLARGVVRPLGIFGVVVAAAGYGLWTEQIGPSTTATRTGSSCSSCCHSGSRRSSAPRAG